MGRINFKILIIEEQMLRQNYWPKWRPSYFHLLKDNQDLHPSAPLTRHQPKTSTCPSLYGTISLCCLMISSSITSSSLWIFSNVFVVPLLWRIRPEEGSKSTITENHLRALLSASSSAKTLLHSYACSQTCPGCYIICEGQKQLLEVHHWPMTLRDGST